MAAHDLEEVRTERTQVVSNGAATEQVETVATDPFGERRMRMYKIQQGLYLLFGVIEALIAIRLVLRLLGANPAAAFVSLIYGVTAPLVAPFVGIFGTIQASGNMLEPHSIVALIVYALIAWLLVRLAWLLFGEVRSGSATSARGTTTRI